jgi:hypothetical protein
MLPSPQALSQHTPSLQKPLWQSRAPVSGLQGLPSRSGVYSKK